MPSTGTGDPVSDFAEAPKRQQCHARHCCLPALSATRSRRAWMEPMRNIGSSSSGNSRCRCLFSTSELAVKLDWLCPCKKSVPVPLSCLPRAQPAVVPLPALVLSFTCLWIWAPDSTRHMVLGSLSLRQHSPLAVSENRSKRVRPWGVQAGTGFRPELNRPSCVCTCYASCYSSIGCVCVTQLQRPSHHLPSTSACTCTLYT